MQLELITAGLEELLIKNNYSPGTIKIYKREWSKITKFLEKTYADTEFDMSRGLKYLEVQYGIVSLANKHQLPQQRVQMIRMVQMLEDYRIHKCLTRRYYASNLNSRFFYPAARKSMSTNVQNTLLKAEF